MHLMPVWPQRCCSQCPCSHLYPGLTVSFSPMRCRNLSCGFLFSEQNAGPLGVAAQGSVPGFYSL